MDGLFENIIAFAVKLDKGVVFLVSCILIYCMFAFALICKIKKARINGYIKGYIIFSTSIFILENGLICLENNLLYLIFYDLLTVFWASFLGMFFIFGKNKEINVTKEQKNLIESIDKKIEKEKFSPQDIVLKVMADKPLKEKEEKEEVNFSHVKSIIDRLNGYSLSNVEKKQVENLKLSLLEAENGEKNTAIKIGINEGLNALLKIMSKYHV